MSTASARSSRSWARQSASESLPVRWSSSASRIWRYLASRAASSSASSALSSASSAPRRRSGALTSRTISARTTRMSSRSMAWPSGRDADLAADPRRVARPRAAAGAARRRPQRDQPAEEGDQRADPDPRDHRRDDQPEGGGRRVARVGAGEAVERLAEERVALLGAQVRAREDLVALLDTRAQRADVGRDRGPDVAPPARAQADLAGRLALEEARDRAQGRRQRREVGLDGAHVGDLLAVARHAQPRAEVDPLEAAVGGGLQLGGRLDVGDAVGADVGALAGPQQHLALVLEARGGGDADEQHGDARVDEVAAIAAAVAADELDERRRDGVAGHRAAGAHAAEELLADRGQH